MLYRVDSKVGLFLVQVNIQASRPFIEASWGTYALGELPNTLAASDGARCTGGRLNVRRLHHSDSDFMFGSVSNFPWQEGRGLIVDLQTGTAGPLSGTRNWWG